MDSFSDLLDSFQPSFNAAVFKENTTARLLQYKDDDDGGRRKTQEIYFDENDIRCLRPYGRLNDVCINEFSKLLQRYYKEHHTPCALLSTHILDDKISHEKFFKRYRYTRFYAKNLWFIPIHSKAPYEHWTLAVVFFENKTIYHFDSFANREQWHSDVKVHDSTLHN